MRHPWISITNWFEDFMAKHPKAAQFVNWYEPDIDPSDPASYPEEHAEFWQSAKKAPAEATAEAKETKKNIIYLSLSRQQPKRKVVR
ncbi:hypothetical protein [Lacticaseibacillus suibinensis]|uniref:hypothetical protein n=1 Tax=Lacticaseibacillus suibinensis TaxID=2486011 RepID=UPI000F76A5FA|nr:hypothetical protein [Lacticaseibacillus suibinensis]